VSTASLALFMVEHAPDRQTAEMAAMEALRAGVTSSRLRWSWFRWERQQQAARRRGETA
jgi:hypothetical protein